MMLVDDRVGSADLLKPLCQAGLPAELLRLDYADIAFIGKGADNTTLNIGIEFKNIHDLVSSLRSGRLSGHQLPGLRDSYDHAWLLIEGIWSHNETGQLVTYQGKSGGWMPMRGGMTASELEKQILTLELCGGLHVRYTTRRSDSVRFLSALYHWWTDRALDQHTSHLAVHTAPTLFRISEVRQALMRWPGIGRKLSASAEDCFGSISTAANATVEQWAAVESEGRRLGVKKAATIVEFLKRRAE